MFLGVAFLAAGAGTGIGAMALLILLCYGLFRGVQVMTRGKGGKRFAIGLGMIVFTLFASANYFASLDNYPSERRHTTTAVIGIRNIVMAELDFHKSARLDSNKNGVGEYGTLKQLHDAELISNSVLTPREDRGYRYTLILKGDPNLNEKEFFVYASPVHYGTTGRTISLVDAFRPQRTRITFATDESGIIRQADVGSLRSVTREETQEWKKVGD